MFIYVYFVLDSLYNVDLQKPIDNSHAPSKVGGLGFSIVGGQGVHRDPLYCVPRVKEIFLNGPAAKQGDIHTGDVLLEVNAIQVHDLSHHVSLHQYFGLITILVTIKWCKYGERFYPESFFSI